MKSRIQFELEQNSQKADRAEVKELLLDCCRSPHVDGLTDEFAKLEKLSMNNVGLTTLKGFPKLAKLAKLELSDNRFADGLENLVGCGNIRYLNLSGTKIKELAQIKPLAQLAHLNTLDLYNCEVTTKEPDYRAQVFKTLPQLKFLDGFDVNDEENDADSDDDDDDDDEEEEADEKENEGEDGDEENENEEDFDDESEDDDDEDEDEESEDEDEDEEDSEDDEAESDDGNRTEAVKNTADDDQDDDENTAAKKKSKLDEN